MKPLTFYFHSSSVNIKSAKTSNYCVFTDTVPRYKFIKRQAFYSIVIVPLSRLHPASFYVFSKRTRAPGTRSLLRSDWQLRCPLSYCTPSFLLSSKLFFILLSVFPLSVIRQLFFLNYRHKKIRV